MSKNNSDPVVKAGDLIVTHGFGSLRRFIATGELSATRLYVTSELDGEIFAKGTVVSYRRTDENPGKLYVDKSDVMLVGATKAQADAADAAALAMTERRRAELKRHEAELKAIAAEYSEAIVAIREGRAA